MSWLDRLNNIKLEIITGDGAVFQPKWMNARKNVRYNTEGFDFVGVPGTYVQRNEQSGQRFPIELHFTGEDCIEITALFIASAEDKRPWTIKHPFYDDILVQPVSLSIDDTNYNDSKITGVVWETITTKFPDSIVVAEDTILNLKATMDLQTIDSIGAKILTPDIGLITPSLNAITNIDKNYSKLAVLTEDVQILKDLTRTASGAAQNMLDDFDSFLTTAIALVNFPFQIAQTLEFKLEKVKNSIDELFSIFNQDDDQQASIYEALATGSLSEMSRLAVVPGDDDYQTRTSVLNAFDLLGNLYASVLVNFDSSEYIQDAGLAFNLDLIINLSLVNLYEIAFEAKQERIILTDKDDNIINLAHKHYGPGDERIETFIQQNNITLDEHLIIKKGREVIYYV